MEMKILNKKAAGVDSAAATPSVKGPEDFFFVFICRGSKAAFKQIEEYIKRKTTARLIFQRFSRNYLSVSEIKAETVFPREAEADDWPDSLPGCFLNYGKPKWPNGPCESCRVQRLCRKSGGLEE